MILCDTLILQDIVTLHFFFSLACLRATFLVVVRVISPIVWQPVKLQQVHSRIVI